MAKDITINNIDYEDVPAIDVPLTNTQGTARFTDVSDTTAEASDVRQGEYFYNANGVRTEGTSTGGGSGQAIIRDTTDVHGGTIRSITTDEEIYMDELSVTENGTYDAPTGVAYERLTVNVAGSSITVDDELSTTSENPVQNKVITNALNLKADASSVPTKVSDLTNDSGFMTSSDVSSGYVAKESGKGLSSNDYTTSEKNKLSGIASGAEVNQNAFSNVKVGSSTIQADGKTDTLELAAGSNITLTPDTTNDKVTIAATVPTKTSDLTNDSGFLTSVPSQYVTDTELATELSGYVEVESGKGLSSNDYTSAEKTKLGGIASGAEVNQNAFSTINVVDQGHDVDVDIDAGAKQDTFTISAGNNITLGYSAANKEMTISASGGGSSIDPATATPLMDGTGAVGSSAKYAREDHVHPSDTTKVEWDEIAGSPSASPLSVGCGGTGATTASAALVNLGLTTVDVSSSYTLTRTGGSSGSYFRGIEAFRYGNVVFYSINITTTSATSSGSNLITGTLGGGDVPIVGARALSYVGGYIVLCDISTAGNITIRACVGECPATSYSLMGSFLVA